MTSAAPAPHADFLARLADRALDAAPRVEPRLPSLFEAKPDGAGLLGGGWGEGGDPSVEDNSDSVVWSAVRRTVAAPAGPGEEPPVIIPREPAPAVPARPPYVAPAPVSALDAPPAVRTPIAHAPSLPIRRIANAETSQAWSRPQAVRPAPAGPEEPAPPSGEARAPRTRRGAAPVVPALEHRAEARAPRERANADQARDPRAAEQHAPPQRLEPARPLVAPPPVPVVAPGSSRRDLRGPEPPPPEAVINITIGRIDIRAQSEPPASIRATPQPARAAAQSLEDYLKQRAAGR